ncbi:MAG: kua-ubiquitin conjugating enzyme hybrid localization domain protein [Acidobacteriia bacterium]|nr:kua-ubiquitin conjugating enzyme hybrid localization domain protein [Terriglobia bacterium]
MILLRTIEAIALLLFTILFTGLLRSWVQAISGLWDVLLSVPALVAGYLAADLVSGLVHWFCDTFFEETTPYVGPMFIHPFRDHHRDPTSITRHGFLELTGNSCLALLPVLTLVQIVQPNLFWQAGWFTFSFGLFLTNLFHRWAHLSRPPAWVRLLQRSRLVLSPGHHRRHHSGSHDTAFCVTTGWGNLALDLLPRILPSRTRSAV